MTISVTVLTGDYAGQTRTMYHSVKPLELLGGFAKVDTRWEVHFEGATANETLEWGRADIVGRILAALFHGRYVRVEVPRRTTEWRLDNPPALTFPVSEEQAVTAVSQIDDALSDSGMNFYVKQDDAHGVTISTHGMEHSVH